MLLPALAHVEREEGAPLYVAERLLEQAKLLDDLERRRRGSRLRILCPEPERYSSAAS